MKRQLMRSAGWGLVLSFAFALGLFPTTSQAEESSDCAITYTRTACPGKEEESYSKCDGKKTCTKYVAAANEAACATAAVAACANDRLTITQSKVITANYKGKVLKTKGGKEDMCLDYAKRDTEFNQCSKK